jgi:hypothetical protein
MSLPPTPNRLVKFGTLLSTQTHITPLLCRFLSSAMNGFVALNFQFPNSALYYEDYPQYSEACQSDFEVEVTTIYHPRLLVRVKLAKTLRPSSMAAHPVVLGVALVPSMIVEEDIPNGARMQVAVLDVVVFPSDEPAVIAAAVVLAGHAHALIEHFPLKETLIATTMQQTLGQGLLVESATNLLID